MRKGQRIRLKGMGQKIYTLKERVFVREINGAWEVTPTLLVGEAPMRFWNEDQMRTVKRRGPH